MSIRAILNYEFVCNKCEVSANITQIKGDSVRAECLCCGQSEIIGSVSRISQYYFGEFIPNEPPKSGMTPSGDTHPFRFIQNQLMPTIRPPIHFYILFQLES